MSGGGGIIIIHGRDAGGQDGQDYQAPVAQAESAYTILKNSPSFTGTAFMTALENAITEANS